MSGKDQPQPDSPLTAWVKTHLGSLYESAIGEENEFQTTFNSVFSEEAVIYLNHERISRGDFGTKISASRSALARSPTIEWKEMLEIPAKAEEGATSGPFGIVAGFFVVTRSLKFKIRASNAQTLDYTSFSARISQGDQTKITELFLTSLSRAAPIHLHSVPTRS